MDGVLIIDKPPGLTSHDVVAVARRRLGEPRIGHTGTLDPLASGVLPLACGRATRLVRFLATSDKDYEAVIRFGVATDSYDITGTEISRSGLEPSRDAVERGLKSLRGEYDQMPPAYSAKRIGGHRAYTLARRDEAVELKAVPVRVARADLVSFDAASATVAITCSAGFYVRTFAHVLGELAGTGACLQALRRTRSGDFHIASAMSLEELMTRPEAASERLLSLEQLLPGFPTAHLTDEGRRCVTHGRESDRSHLAIDRDSELGIRDSSPPGEWVRMLDVDGHLLALGTRG